MGLQTVDLQRHQELRDLGGDPPLIFATELLKRCLLSEISKHRSIAASVCCIDIDLGLKPRRETGDSCCATALLQAMFQIQFHSPLALSPRRARRTASVWRPR